MTSLLMGIATRLRAILEEYGRIVSTQRYTALAPDRFRKFWKDLTASCVKPHWRPFLSHGGAK
jgi:hypothetical protein